MLLYCYCFFFKDKLKANQLKIFIAGAITIILVQILGSVFSEKIILYGEQIKYKDKIVIQDESIYQKIIVTKWKNDYWLYLNDNLQFSTFDEPMYHEVLVHPIMVLLQYPRKILILGGGDGCAVRELLKYQTIENITLVDIDEKLTDLFINNKHLSNINQNALIHPKVKIVNQDGFAFINKTQNFYDLIVVDLPDPRSVELSRLYSKEFYELCYLKLTPKGGIITQAGSPYYTPNAFKCIDKTIQSAKYSTLPLHNQILSMGEWGWIAGTKEQLSLPKMKAILQQFDTTKVTTKWLTKEAMLLITNFGKDFYTKNKIDSIQVNQINNPVLYHYYKMGNWDTY